MTRHAKKAPDWPKSLEFVPSPTGSTALAAEAAATGVHLTVAPCAFVMTETGPTVTLAEVKAAVPEALSALRTTAHLKPTPILAIALGTLKDGRHAAMALQVSGREVTSATLLDAGPELAAAAQSCHEAAFLRLWLRKDFATYEAAEHAPLDPAAIRDAVAVALPLWKGKVGAVAFDVEGRTVTEPRVLATSDRLFAWDVLEAWMSINLLPRNRR